MKWVCMSEAARQIGVSHHTIRGWIACGELPARIFPKGRKMINVEDIKVFIESRPHACPKSEVLEVLEVLKQDS
jgi:excisionase family DNA binding protein